MLVVITSDASSSTLGMGSIMISSSLGLLALDKELFSLFWAVLLSSLLTSAAAPGTLRLKKKLIVWIKKRPQKKAVCEVVLKSSSSSRQ